MEKSNISRYLRFSFLSHTFIPHIHNGAIDSNLELFQKSVNIFTLSPLPHDSDDKMTSFMKSSRHVEVEQILD